MQKRVAKLFVEPSANGVKLLRYLNANIGYINNGQHVILKIERLADTDLDDDTVAVFKKKGITRLPALVLQDGAVVLGVDQIVGLFEKRLNRMRAEERVGGGCDVNDYLHNEIRRGVKVKAGKFEVGDEDDEDEQKRESADMMGQFAQTQRQRAPMRKTEREEDDMDADQAIAAANARSPGGGRPPARQDNIANYDQDDINIQGDDIDSQMLRALMNNTPGDY